MVEGSVLAGRHVAYVVNTDWFFLSHRAALARAAVEAGMRVTVVTPDTGRGREIRDMGLAFVPAPLLRSGTNPLRELGSLVFLHRLYRRLRPDIVHHVTPKPVIYGSLAARVLPGIAVVNAVSGLGHVFSHPDGDGRLGWLVGRLYRAALEHPRSLAVFQNPDDRDLFVGLGWIDPSRATLVRGSGVDCRRFRPSAEPCGDPLVMLPTRLLRDKGVLEFVEAATILRREGRKIRFVLVGRTDEGNPSAVSRSDVESWVSSGVVEWWPHSEDMPATFSQAHVVALPTYREGLPRVLLEAAACARVIVATDVPGCREVVFPGESGLLVPPRDPLALARAIESLVADPGLRGRLAARGRELVAAHFSVERVVRETLDIYARLLSAGDTARGLDQ